MLASYRHTTLPDIKGDSLLALSKQMTEHGPARSGWHSLVALLHPAAHACCPMQSTEDTSNTSGSNASAQLKHAVKVMSSVPGGQLTGLLPKLCMHSHVCSAHAASLESRADLQVDAALAFPLAAHSSQHRRGCTLCRGAEDRAHLWVGHRLLNRLVCSSSSACHYVCLAPDSVTVDRGHAAAVQTCSMAPWTERSHAGKARRCGSDFADKT